MNTKITSMARRVGYAVAGAGAGLVLMAKSVFAVDPTVSATDANTLIGAIIQFVKDFYFTNTLVAVAITLLVLLALAFKVMRWLGARPHR